MTTTHHLSHSSGSELTHCRNRHKNRQTECQLSGAEVENLHHCVVVPAPAGHKMGAIELRQKEVYCKDMTKIKMNKDKEIETNIINGIRQGCTVSTTLFKLITYMILDKLQKNGCGYRDYQVTINTLFFAAADGLQMSTSKEDAVKNIEDLIEISKSCGLELNKVKSYFILLNANEEINEIEE